jgi:hypothetical protein
MNDTRIPPEEPANLKFLRRLVTLLTATMITGVIIIIGLLVMRLNAPMAAVSLPDRLELPDGSTATAFTKGIGWYAVVTSDQRILIYDAKSGALRQTITIETGNP